MAKEVKTNAMRILDRLKIAYSSTFYECGEFVDGIDTAEKLSLPKEQVYKTLVTKGQSKQHYVFVIPIEAELDLKKAAKVVSEKSITMIHVKEITEITGYVRGGCTALGMKKQYKTILDISAKQHPFIYVSGGRIGCQIQLNPEDFCAATKAEYNDICILLVNH